jgi:hypothetical protein
MSDVKLSYCGNQEFATIFGRITATQKCKQDELINAVLARGVKLLHPNDGWVVRNSLGFPVLVQPCYPMFNHLPKIGDLIALGSSVDDVVVCRCKAIHKAFCIGAPRYELEPAP